MLFLPRLWLLVKPLLSSFPSSPSLGVVLEEMGPSCSDKLNARNGLWNEDEGVKILGSVSRHGTCNWTDNQIKKAEFKKCGKSCSRLRSKSYLKPDLRNESFTPQEEELIIRLHCAIGSRWPIIAQQLPGRTDNDVKNYWNTKLKKKLSAMGIDPVTHRPFSQILADYGNIGGGLPRARASRLIGSLSRDMIKTAVFLSNQEQSPIPSLNFLNPDIKMESNPEMKTNSLDLLTQLQSIALYKDASSNEISPVQFYTDFSSSSSASSSCTATNDVNNRPTQNFSWRDFLNEDEFISGNDQEQIPLDEINTNGDENYQAMEFPMNGFKERADSDGMFVESMLDGDNMDMFLDIPGLLEEPFYL